MIKSILLGIVAGLLLALGVPVVKIANAFAKQAPAIAYNLRTASYHGAVATANTAQASANVAEATGHLKTAAQQLADPKTGAAAQLRGVRVDANTAFDKSLGEVKEFRGAAERTVNAALGRVDDAITIADRTERDAAGSVDSAIAAANMHLLTFTGAVDEFKAGLIPILKHANSITGQFDDALPPFLQCAYYDDNGEPIGANVDCLFNRYQGSSKSFERIAVDFQRIADKFTGPRSLKAKIWDGVKLGALVGTKLPIMPAARIAVPRRVPTGVFVTLKP